MNPETRLLYAQVAAAFHAAHPDRWCYLNGRWWVQLEVEGNWFWSPERARSHLVRALTEQLPQLIPDLPSWQGLRRQCTTQWALNQYTGLLGNLYVSYLGLPAPGPTPPAPAPAPAPPTPAAGN